MMPISFKQAVLGLMLVFLAGPVFFGITTGAFADDGPAVPSSKTPPPAIGLSDNGVEGDRTPQEGLSAKDEQPSAGPLPREGGPVSEPFPEKSPGGRSVKSPGHPFLEAIERLKTQQPRKHEDTTDSVYNPEQAAESKKRFEELIRKATEKGQKPSQGLPENSANQTPTNYP
jgi:hypothetical protein